MSRESRRQFAVLSRIRQSMDEFYDLQKIGEGFSVEAALQHVLALAMDEIEFHGGGKARRALVVVRSGEGFDTTFSVSAGWSDSDTTPGAQGENLRTFSQTIVESVLNTGQSVLVRDVGEDDRFKEVQSLRAIRALSVLAIPIRVEGSIEGALYLDSTDLVAAFSAEDEEFLQKFAAIISPHLKSAVVHQRHLEEIKRLKSELEVGGAVPSLVAKSSVMQPVFERIKRVTEDPDIRVLILGETGTGKELVARSIHSQGPRGDQPFVALNCAAIPQELMESELFGHEAGSFTGAAHARSGRFEEAHMGTLFLDEVGDLDLGLQAKLLRVLETGSFQRIGSSKDTVVDVRILAATHQDLKKMTAKNQFRDDLYHRLNVFPVEIPPLRDRTEDIPLLAQHFLERLNKRKKKQVKGFTPSAMHVLCASPWPGNVRELENTVERCHLLADKGWIDVSYLPELRNGEDGETVQLSQSPDLFSKNLTLKELNREYARQVVARVATKAEACAILGITDKTLNRLLAED